MFPAASRMINFQKLQVIACPYQAIATSHPVKLSLPFLLNQ
jgi:hypothetical protein